MHTNTKEFPIHEGEIQKCIHSSKVGWEVGNWLLLIKAENDDNSIYKHLLNGWLSWRKDFFFSEDISVDLTF